MRLSHMLAVSNLVALSNLKLAPRLYLQGQIRMCRQSAILPNKMWVQPLPPPHVSYTPPYVQLTAWIRQLLAANQLTFDQIKALRKPFRVVSKSVSNPRVHRVECVIYPSTAYMDNETENEAPSPISRLEPSLCVEDQSDIISLRDKESNQEERKQYTVEPRADNGVLIEEDDLITLVLSGSEPGNEEEEYVPYPDEEYVPYNEDEMMYLLPKALLQTPSLQSSRYASVMGTSGESEYTPSPNPRWSENQAGNSFYPATTKNAPWGKRLPVQDELWYGKDDHLRRLENKFNTRESTRPDYRTHRAASDGYYQSAPPPSAIHHCRSVPEFTKRPADKSTARLNDSDSDRDTESPPNWISCFTSPRSKRKNRSKGKRESNPKTESPIRYIDDSTPDCSVDNLYSSPILSSYEALSKHEGFQRPSSRSARPTTVKGVKRKSRSLSRNRRSCDIELAVIPVREMESLDLQTTTVGTGPANVSAVVADVHPVPSQTPCCTRAPQPPASRCICDSRRSSDSGLADVSAHVNVCPLSPLGKGSLQSMGSLPQFPSTPHLSQYHSSQGLSSHQTSRLSQYPSSPGLAQYSRHQRVSKYSSSPGIANGQYPSMVSSVSQYPFAPGLSQYPVTAGSPQYSAHPERLSQPQHPSSPRLSRISSRSTGQSSSLAGSRTKLVQLPTDVNQNMYVDPHRNMIYQRNESEEHIYSNPGSVASSCSCRQEFHYTPAYNSAQSNASPRSPSLQRKKLPGLAAGRQIPSEHSVSLDDLGRSVNLYRLQAEQAFSCTDIPSRVSDQGEHDNTQQPLTFYTEHTMYNPEQSSWSNIKQNYKSGLYAHWWMNASLQPIREEFTENHPVDQ